MENSQRLETSDNLIKECILDLYINPKKSMVKWSKITNQTAQGKFAYPSQHLASLITGIKGKGSAARGDDLADGSEIKSCSRADQLRSCNNCGANVLLWQKECPNCGSTDIKVDTSSHWIFPIRSDDELDLLLNRVPRIIFILFDKEDSESENIRIRAWTVNPQESYVKAFFTDYYVNNFKMKTDKGEKPAPCNLHPLKYDFFMMRPKLIFHADIIENDVEIEFWDLKHPKEQPMFSHLLSKEQLIQIFGKKVSVLKKTQIVEKFPYIPQKDFDKLVMKKKVLKKYKQKYVRR
ncbi:MAG: MamI family restriction endonuclease [Candidatus Micrarchaeales archaeon]|jgi:ribosomal protein S27AE|nr:MamI family restriction endonuclease [Candidatus Micrarchaeales archaeon]